MMKDVVRKEVLKLLNAGFIYFYIRQPLGEPSSCGS